MLAITLLLRRPIFPRPRGFQLNRELLNLIWIKAASTLGCSSPTRARPWGLMAMVAPLLFEAKRQNMGVMGDDEYLSKGNDWFVEMHPI